MRLYTVTLLLITAAAAARAQDGFDLGDALDFDDVPKKTTAKPKIPAAAPTKAPAPPPKQPNKPSDGDLNLFDAFGPDEATQKPKVPPKRTGDSGGGSFDDSDLGGVANDGDYQPDKGKARASDPYPAGGGADEPQAGGSSQIAGIVSAVGVALIGAASSYFAYQKKKLCFKMQGGGDPESANRGQGNQTEPQLLSNLLRTS